MPGDFYLIDGAALPEVFHKVLRVKALLASGEAKTVSEAVEQTGLSRSAFYKYKDMIYTFRDKSKDRVVSLMFTLRDEPGVVSGILAAVAKQGCNILTLHQGLPSGNVAIFTLSIETQHSTASNDELVSEVTSLRGVVDVRVLGSE
ncbi:hypothetical protein SDC9_64091 [bioreactor metagenome]|uniref:ACT domain-containing protein n=1 Tax=bioreactor metagenome TaxID=1076179 RepID=A0A644XUA4_9ZZZZ